MDTIRRVLKATQQTDKPRMLVRVETVEKMLADYDEIKAMITAFRHAANSLALEAGITKDHVSHEVAEASVCQKDGYYLDLIRGAEHRLERLSVKYERLRAAGVQILQAHYRSEVDWNAMRDMDEVLKDD
jgi:flagellar capping protein FliD